MNKIDLSTPSKQEVRGLLIIFAFELQKTVRVLWPIFIALFVQQNALPANLSVGMVLLILAGLLVAHTVLYYFHFIFYVDGDQFILKKGYLKKKVLTIPIERIQSVNTKQNLLQQILNVYSLEIDTAGSAGKELKIHSLNGTYAAELTQYLRALKTETQGPDSASEQYESDQKEALVLKLTAGDLLRIGISQNHLRTGLIILAFGWQIYGQIKDLFKDKAENYSNEAMSYMSNSNWLLISGLFIFFLTVSIGASLLLTVFKYYDFTLFKQNKSYRISSGLINRRNVIIPFTKVQQLNWETGPIKKLFGIFKITFKQAVSKQSRKTQLVDAPGCLGHHLEATRNELFEDSNIQDSTKTFAHPSYIRIYWIKTGLIPLLLALALAPAIYNQVLYWVGIALWIILSLIYAYMATKKRYFQFDGSQIIIGKGAITNQWQQTHCYKTQTVTFRQSIFQKRRHIATLHINNASGQMSIPYIDEKMAHQLLNYLVYHVEISTTKWM